MTAEFIELNELFDGKLNPFVPNGLFSESNDQMETKVRLCAYGGMPQWDTDSSTLNLIDCLNIQPTFKKQSIL